MSSRQEINYFVWTQSNIWFQGFYWSSSKECRISLVCVNKDTIKIAKVNGNGNGLSRTTLKGYLSIYWKHLRGKSKDWMLKEHRKEIMPHSQTPELLLAILWPLNFSVCQNQSSLAFKNKFFLLSKVREMTRHFWVQTQSQKAPTVIKNARHLNEILIW